MVVKLVKITQRWVGKSSDIKPSNPPQDSTYEEYDTGEIYIYIGYQWQLADKHRIAY